VTAVATSAAPRNGGGRDGGFDHGHGGDGGYGGFGGGGGLVLDGEVRSDFTHLQPYCTAPGCACGPYGCFCAPDYTYLVQAIIAENGW